MRTTAVTSRANPRVKQLRAAFLGRARLSGGLVAIEGEHLLFEAMRSGMVFKTIFVSERRSVPEWTPTNVELIELTDEVFASVVDTQSPQGIAALLVPPTWNLEEATPAGRIPLLLIVAGLQDPGNLGTLIRSAEAFAATAVLTTANTVSEWNQKALRASAGSVFRVPVVQVTASEIVALKSSGVRVLAAVAPDSESNLQAAPGGTVPIPAATTDLSGPCALMIGNEGAGLAHEWLQLADGGITIPTPGGIESLNAAVAGSLLLYEAARQRHASNLVPAL
jgi:RNA methyltransferase, TrmH family